MLNVVMDCSVFMKEACVTVIHIVKTNLMKMSICVKVNENNISTPVKKN
jgi:hypothetical protein